MTPLINCQIMAQATSKVKVGTWITNVYLRHPALCAQTAVAIDDTSKGRLILGLGVSHRPIVEGVYQEKMDKPRTFLRNYIGAVRDVAAGKEIPGMAMQPRAASYAVPIYIGALALGTVQLRRRAGRRGDALPVSCQPTADRPGPPWKKARPRPTVRSPRSMSPPASSPAFTTIWTRPWRRPNRA